MSPQIAPAHMPINPVTTGRMPLHAGANTIASMTTTTTTITTGSGWESVRE
jgi:hypothetical protein